VAYAIVEVTDSISVYPNITTPDSTLDPGP
jgi:hypothetical protein